MPVTIQQIAEEAGVPKSAVSVILNGKAREARISARRQILVRQVADRLGFRPNAAARAISTGRFGAVALLMGHGETISTTPVLLQGALIAGLQTHDTHLILTRLPDEKLTNDGYIPKILSQNSADALLVNYTHGIPQKMIQLIRTHHVPSIWLNSKQETDCVHADDLEAARRATEHLLRLGHRRIAFVSYSHGAQGVHNHYSAHDRRAGYEQAMTAAGLAPQVIVPPGLDAYTTHERVAVTRQWLAQPDRPTAVLTYGETTALPILHAAALQNISVPSQLSLISFDETPTKLLGPRMTTMLVPQWEIGLAAVDAVMQKVAQPDQELPCRTVRFGFDPGETTAPPSGVPQH